MNPGQIYDGFIPGRYLIDAYGDGGFRFADMSHRGSIAILPSGIHAWRRDEAVKLTASVLEADFNLIMEKLRHEAAEIDLLLIGTGNTIVMPEAGLRSLLTDIGIRFEVMQTGTALRMYNMLFEEQRRIAVVAVAVDN